MNQARTAGLLSFGAMLLVIAAAQVRGAAPAATAAALTPTVAPRGGPGGAEIPGGPPGALLRLSVARGIEYARVGSRVLALDLYRDAAAKDAQPLIVWVHGGGWIMGDRFPTPAARLVANGYVVASVDYRLAGEARFPAQLHDIKAAVRWLRANASRYNLDANHIGAWGSSAGAHLVALLGTTADVKELEGTEGNLEQSSRVQAAVDFYGPIDLMRMDETASKPKSDAPDLAEAILLGGPMSQNMAKALAANPITYISKDDAPFLIVQGTNDKIVPARQSEFFQVALKTAGVENDLEYVIGAGHMMSQVQTPAVAEMVNSFFDKHLRGGKHQRDDINSYVVPDDSYEDPIADDMGGTTYRQFAATSLGPNRRASYRLYLPAGYGDTANAARRYPVIYYLHGLNDDSRRAIRNGYIQRADMAMRNGIMPPAIIILVQGLNTEGYVDSADGKTPMESIIAKDLVAHVDKTYRTLTDRAARAIEGHSMGGAGALRIGFKYPELFGTVAAIAAAVSTQEPMPGEANQNRLNMLYGGDLARFQADQPAALLERNAERIRGRTQIRLICGELDAMMLPRNQWLAAELKRLNIAHEFVVSKGAPHFSKEVLARLDTNPFEFYGKAFAAFK
jgi:acetyl esterase/lipase/esterase/lipase superfamily enzyme